MSSSSHTRHTHTHSLFLAAPLCSFFTAADGRLAKAIMTILQEANQIVPPELVSFAQVSGGHHGGGSESSGGHLSGRHAT